MNKGPLGTQNLNTALQKRLNNSEGKRIASFSKFGFTYGIGDKVIQLVNNYKKEIFNGDIGIVHSITEENLLTIDFEGRLVIYEVNELDELALAYAVSIHKSQGSEYSAVVIPVTTSHYTMLERNLFYTAITRGKKLVVLIGQSKALSIAIKNRRAFSRVTSLKFFLQKHLADSSTKETLSLIK